MEVLPIHSVKEHQQRSDFDDIGLLKQQIQEFAATALGLDVRKIQKKSHKSWLALGGDSLMAVNFMGACHEAGIRVDIPHVLQAQSLDELIDGIAQLHYATKLKSNGVEKLQNGDEMSSIQQPLGDGIQGIGPCSPMQENFIAVQSHNPNAYRMHLAVMISSIKPGIEVTAETVKHAWKAVVKRHATLRTTFVDSASRPGRLDQIVWKDLTPQISILPFDEAEENQSLGEHENESPHHLTLAEAPNNRVFVRLVISHALVDAVSIQLLFRDLFRALSGTLPAGQHLQCEDYFQALQPDKSPEALAYWSDYTQSAKGSFLCSPSLKTNLTRMYAVNKEMLISPELALNLSDQFNTTLVNACQTAWALVLRSYTGESNVCFSYTASGRHKRIKGLQEAAGNFVNTLPCHLDLDNEIVVSEALGRVQKDLLDSFPYQGADLTDSQGMSGGSVRQLGDSLLSFQRGIPEEEIEQAGFALEVLRWEAPSDVSTKRQTKRKRKLTGDSTVQLHPSDHHGQTQGWAEVEYMGMSHVKG